MNPEQYEQMTIFDLLPREDWGDARPEPKPKVNPHPVHKTWEEWKQNRSAQYEQNISRNSELVQSKKDTADNVCVWCGGQFADLDTHESECSPD